MRQLITGFFLLIYIISQAQLSYEKRIEIELKDGYKDEKLIKFDKKGFLLQSRSNKAENGNYEYKNLLYDSDLNAVKSHSLFLDKSFSLSETYSDFDRAHMIFLNNDGEFKLISLDADGLKETKVEGNLPKNTFISNMLVLGDYAFFQANVKRNNLVISINWKTGEFNIIPISIKGYKSKKLKIINFEILHNSNEVFIYVKALKKKVANVYVIRISEKGEKKDAFRLKNEVGKNITNVSASFIEDEKYIFTGIYSTKTAPVKLGRAILLSIINLNYTPIVKSFIRTTPIAEGFFFCKTDKGQVDFMEYYNFLDLDNFLNYLPEGKKERLKRMKKRKDEKGKELNFNYNIASHPVIQLDDGFLLIGEAFYSTYRVEENFDNSNTLEFDGYQYTHAVIVKFDKNGKIVWDQSFEMWPSHKPYEVERFISIAEQKQNAIKLVFSSNDFIVSKSFTFDGEVNSYKSIKKIETGFEDDKTKWSYSNIEFWYDNYFLAYGSQKIKNKSGEAYKRRRLVYFINKVKY